ncbi:hypothetical protein BDBG_03100 [Blastomyces gilchristii SLH14081]|uniref:CCHC-type domain-containing protein n=1 Tax=Blastomyces gilchristii (strain SLH14081) TaxID=559298 RepID=A0A179UI87_BLAGS|nr:uncharacterized protein BDBG_03100 [Blastomyces gilchristii SLH14081]OAT06978.1 hypothetical protein BDBG_03100 [Blastomyces gilchristii SLH14081]
MNDHLTKLKSIQNSGRRHYTPVTYTPASMNNPVTYTPAPMNNPVTYTPALTDNPATHTPTPKNKNNHDADAMDWIDSNAYAQARVSAVRTGFRVPGITPKEVTDQCQRGVCINCNQSGHIAFNCRSTYVPSHSRERPAPPQLRERSVPPCSKDGSAPVRANYIAVKEDSEDNYENAPMKQGKD